MAKEMKFLEENEYNIFSDNEIIRVDYGDNLPRIKKVYENSKGYYVKGQAYWEPSALYLRNYNEKKIKFQQDVLDQRKKRAILEQVENKQKVEESEKQNELPLWVKNDLNSLKTIIQKNVDIVRLKFFAGDTTADEYNQDILLDYGKKGKDRCLTNEEFTNLTDTLRRLGK